MGHWRETATALLVGLYEAEGARETLEHRYLSGHGSLFPVTVDSWQELIERTEGLYEMAITLREGDTFESPEALNDGVAFEAEAIADCLVRMATHLTHAAMGEHERARAALQQLMTA